MSTPSPISLRCSLRPALAVLLVAIALPPRPAASEPSMPVAPVESVATPSAGFDRTQCMREIQRVAQPLLERIVHAGGEVVRELEATSVRMRGVLREACNAVVAIVSEEAGTAVERLTDATRQAARSMRDALHGLYGALPDEHKRRLEGLGRPDLDGLRKTLDGWFKDHVSRSVSVPRGDGTVRPLGRICIVDVCYDILGDIGRFSRWREPDNTGQE
jgi:hypothetical protein